MTVARRFRLARLGGLALINLALIAPAASAEPTNGPAPGAMPAMAGSNAAPPELWFPVGETLTYRAYWGVIPVAESVVTTEWFQDNGETLLLIRYRTRSNKVLATLYPVDDVIEAVIEPATFRPRLFMKDMREGRHHDHEITTFDYTRGLARWESLTKGKVKEYPIDPNIRDLVSFLYWMRNQRFSPGYEGTFRVMADEKVYDLFLKADPRYATVDLPAYGKVKCLRIEPQAAFQGLFIRKGRMWLWISQDRGRSVVTQIRASLPVADVHIVLCSVTGPGDDTWVGGKTDDACAADTGTEAALRPSS